MQKERRTNESALYNTKLYSPVFPVLSARNPLPCKVAFCDDRSIDNLPTASVNNSLGIVFLSFDALRTKLGSDTAVHLMTSKYSQE